MACKVEFVIVVVVIVVVVIVVVIVVVTSHVAINKVFSLVY